MSEQKRGFRLRLNLFDSIVLLLALGIAATLLWSYLAPKQVGGDLVPAAETIQYTICLHGTLSGTGALVEPGNALVDAVKNYNLGTVVSSSTAPARTSVLDEDNLILRMAEIPDREDITIVIRATATENDAQLLVDGGFEVRAGEPIYVRGPGYMGSGYITAIERGNGQ